MKLALLPTIVLALALLMPSAATTAFAGAAGGSNAVFTLDPVSWSIVNWPAYTPADVFVDDPGWIPPNSVPAPAGRLTQGLTPAQLGLPVSADIRALSSGNDVVIRLMRQPAWPVLNPPNRMNQPVIWYQFGVERQSTDNWQGATAIPNQSVQIGRRLDFANQFANNDQAADVFQNVPWFPWWFNRWNFFPINQHWFELVGNPLPPSQIDDTDDFSSLGSFGVLSPDDLINVPVYISLDGQTAQGLGGSPGDIWVVSPGLGPQLYASAAQLGIQPEDSIDCHCVLDDDGDFQFNGQDGVVFSLRAGSPSLPITIAGVPINQGGLFLSFPGQPLFTALPAGYFSLQESDDLDAIHCFDPRSDTASLILPFEALYWLPVLLYFDSTDTAHQVDLVLSNVVRADTTSPGGVTGFFVHFSLAESTVARIESVIVQSPFSPTSSYVSPDGQWAEVTASGYAEPESADVRFLTVTIAAEDIGHTELHIDTAAISGYPTPLEFVSFEGIIVVSPPMGARGDCTLDDIIDVADVVYLINYLYRGGPAPEPRDAGDATCDGDLNVGDVVDLINYLYRGGYPPGCP